MEPTAFVSLDTLKSLAGQAMVVVMVTQTVRSALPMLGTYWLRLIAVASGITLHLVLVWQTGMAPSAYALAFVNGTFVALSAMKSVEFLKGDKPPNNGG